MAELSSFRLGVSPVLVSVLLDMVSPSPDQSRLRLERENWMLKNPETGLLFPTALWLKQTGSIPIIKISNKSLYQIL